jgi:hypothetical protein
MMPMAVILQVLAMKERGGPNDDDRKKAEETSDMLGEHGDIIIVGPHKGTKKGEVADLFNRTAHAYAVLAFCPGGVEVFGTQVEAEKIRSPFDEKPEAS